MPIAKQPNLDKALKYRARVNGKYEVGFNGVMLREPVGGPVIIPAGETTMLEMDCDIKLLKSSAAFVSYHPELYKIATVTGPSILAEETNRVTLRIEADEDINTEDLPYIVKVVFENTFS